VIAFCIRRQAEKRFSLIGRDDVVNFFV